MKKHTFLVENYKLNIKEIYSNVIKIENIYGFSRWSIYKSVKRCGEYRNKDYIITKLYEK